MKNSLIWTPENNKPAYKDPAHIQRANEYWEGKEKKVYAVSIGGGIMYIRARTKVKAMRYAEDNQYGRSKSKANGARLADPQELVCKW